MPISSQKIVTHSLYGFTAIDSNQKSHQADLAQYSMEFVKDNCSRILLWLSAYTAQHLWKVFGFYNCGIECVCWVSLQGPWESRSVGEKKDKPLDLDNCNEWVSNFLYFSDVHRSGTKRASILLMPATIYLCELTYIKLQVRHMGTCTNSSPVWWGRFCTFKRLVFFFFFHSW